MKQIVAYDILEDEILILSWKKTDMAMTVSRIKRDTFTSSYGIFFSDNHIILGEL